MLYLLLCCSTYLRNLKNIYIVYKSVWGVLFLFLGRLFFPLVLLITNAKETFSWDVSDSGQTLEQVV